LDVVDADPEAVLGCDTVRRFGSRFPFLLKVLAAEKALALQVHPTEEQAKEGFERETAQGIRPDAPQRNYPDRNHKPELVCALEPFECLAGFRPVGEVAGELKSLQLSSIAAEVERFTGAPSIGEMKRLFESILSLEGEAKDRLIREIVEKAGFSTGERRRWTMELARQYPGDIGVVSSLFLEFLRLHPGQAVYLPPGTVHAYLRGAAIEVMSNSDNVVRGGLSVRHVDVAEFMRILRVNESPVEPFHPREQASGAEEYEVPAPDFRLCRIRLTGNGKYASPGKRAVELLICTSGRAVLRGGPGTEDLAVHPGDSFLVPADSPPYTIQGEAILFKATV
jgi:mannose-6-phosphate isomerase